MRFSALLTFSLLAIPSYAFPTGKILKIPELPAPFHPGFLCGLPLVPRFLCPRQDGSALTVSTPIGTARGTSDDAGAVRFVVKYANHNRWQASTVVTSWQLPYVVLWFASGFASTERVSFRNGQSDTTAMPKACPQLGMNSSAFAEDCLSMVLYVPPSVNLNSKAPAIMWYVPPSECHTWCRPNFLSGFMVAPSPWDLQVLLVSTGQSWQQPQTQSSLLFNIVLGLYGCFPILIYIRN